MHIEKIEEISSVSDILQVGTRNMQNYPLLEALGKQKKPIMLKRHYGASLQIGLEQQNIFFIMVILM